MATTSSEINSGMRPADLTFGSEQKYRGMSEFLWGKTSLFMLLPGTEMPLGSKQLRGGLNAKLPEPFAVSTEFRR
jgi:hypothetical protein